MSKLYAIDSILGVQNFTKDQIVTCKLCKKNLGLRVVLMEKMDVELFFLKELEPLSLDGI